MPPGLKVCLAPSREPLWDEGKQGTYRSGERRDALRAASARHRRIAGASPTARPQPPRQATSAPEHPADRERRSGVVDVLPRPDAQRLQPVGRPGRPVQAGVREHVVVLSVAGADRLRPLRARHRRRPERGHADTADVPDGAPRRRVPHDAGRQVHEQLAVRSARRVRSVGLRRHPGDLLAVAHRSHGEHRRGLAAQDRLRAGCVGEPGVRLHQGDARGPAVLRDVHADDAAPPGRRPPVRETCR